MQRPSHFREFARQITRFTWIRGLRLVAVFWSIRLRGSNLGYGNPCEGKSSKRWNLNCRNRKVFGRDCVSSVRFADRLGNPNWETSLTHPQLVIDLLPRQMCGRIPGMAITFKSCSRYCCESATSAPADSRNRAAKLDFPAILRLGIGHKSDYRKCSLLKGIAEGSWASARGTLCLQIRLPAFADRHRPLRSDRDDRLRPNRPTPWIFGQATSPPVAPLGSMVE